VWALYPTDEYARRRKWFAKKRPRELRATEENLDVFVESLNAGAPPKPILFGFLHVEPSDVLAIDQKGGGNKLAETRLYVYPDVITKTLYLLTMGDKASQHDDIAICKDFVEEIKKDPPTGGTDGSDESAGGK
jgi:hypothetical protein